MFDAPANTVTLEDYLIGVDGNTQSVTVPVDLDNRADHTYRLVRQPDSLTVELYIDNDPVAVASITPWPAADHGDAAQLNRVRFAHSRLNAAWDFFRYHRGATVPRPAAKTSKRAPRKSKGGYQTYVIRPAINNEAILEGQPLPAVCRDETIIEDHVRPRRVRTGIVSDPDGSAAQTGHGPRRPAQGQSGHAVSRSGRRADRA